jgi:S-adenosylmethionine:tRNA ribosyltransferase-isomerase
MLVIDLERGDLRATTVRALADLLGAGDVVVLNDAATLPGVLRGETVEGRPLEVRLAAFDGGTVFRAVLFGDGDHRMPTEARGAAPSVARGGVLRLAGGLEARVLEVDAMHPRLVTIELSGEPARVWAKLVAEGRPVQYAYVERALSLYHVETSFASRPWAAEMPSAGRPLTSRALGALRDRGVAVVGLTHGAGLSSTGDPSLDARLPLRERYDIPELTAAAVEAARGAGRIVAVGTSVVRALESSDRASGGVVRGGEASTDLRLGPAEPMQVVDALLTGIHEPGTSHFELLRALAPEEALEDALRVAEREGFLLHEFGDSLLLLGRARRGRLPDAA